MIRSKYILSAITMLGACTIGFSQLRMGVKAGAGYGYMQTQGKNAEEFIRSAEESNYEMGLLFDFQSNSFYFQPQVLLAFKSGQFENDQEVELYNLYIPVVFGIQLLGPLSIEGGPSYSRILQSNERFDNGVVVYNNGYGYRIGPALRFARLSFYSHIEGNVYETNSQTSLSEPFRINFGAAWRFGGN